MNEAAKNKLLGKEIKKALLEGIDNGQKFQTFLKELNLHNPEMPDLRLDRWQTEYLSKLWEQRHNKTIIYMGRGSGKQRLLCHSCSRYGISCTRDYERTLIHLNQDIVCDGYRKISYFGLKIGG